MPDYSRYKTETLQRMRDKAYENIAKRMPSPRETGAMACGLLNCLHFRLGKKQGNVIWQWKLN